MRGLNRNKRTFYYCLFDNDDTKILDENGNETGEPIRIYKSAISMRANISQATGTSVAEQFGNLESYDKVIVTTDLKCPIDEHTVLFIDKAPEYAYVLSYVYDENEDEYVLTTYRVPVPDYTVYRVAKSINSISIAIRKVTVR